MLDISKPFQFDIFFRVHKVVIASGSKYMVEVFRTYPKMTTVNIPEPCN